MEHSSLFVEGRESVEHQLLLQNLRRHKHTAGLNIFNIEVLFDPARCFIWYVYLEFSTVYRNGLEDLRDPLWPIEVSDAFEGGSRSVDSIDWSFFVLDEKV